MHKNKHLTYILAISCFFCFTAAAQPTVSVKEFSSVVTGNQRFEHYLPLLKKKRVAVVTNITGIVDQTSIVDTLLSLGVHVVKIFGPEHGFRSNADAGTLVKSNKDAKTGLPIVSLYGNSKKPTKDQLKNIDVVVYDIQDVGVRFYTYISTLTYVMQACAKYKIPVIVLDRPNPNGFYVDGPVLQLRYKSFLGLHPVPIVYGMTCGEYAKMVNGEGWLSSDTAAFYPKLPAAKQLHCNLTVVPMLGYDRNSSYDLPVKPSPNLPNSNAVLLYPSLGLFEGTVVGLGRGTEYPFQLIGHPGYKDSTFSFVPLASPLNKSPRYVNQRCYGNDLRKAAYLHHHPKKIELKWLTLMYHDFGKASFFEANFNYHSGNKTLQEQLQNGWNEAEISSSWQDDLKKFEAIRKNYLLYEDFQKN